MARVSVFYDNEEKEQFFMVRGDERYARSTKTILTEVSTYPHPNNFDCTLNVNVLRDVGEGSIVVFDNDIPVMVQIYDETTRTYVETDSIPWNSLLNGKDFKVTGLTYGVSHNLTAKYIGNKSCSPSLSNTVTVIQQDSQRPHSTLTIIGTNNLLQKESTVNIDVDLTNNLDEQYNRGQTITYEFEGITGSSTTDANGRARITINTDDNLGLKTLNVNYEGSENLLPSTASKEYSLGYQIEINCPSMYVYGEPYSIIGRVTDFFGNPANFINQVRLFRELSNSDSLITQTPLRTDGTFEYNENNPLFTEFRGIKVTAIYSNSKTYSDDVAVTYVKPQNVGIIAYSPRLYKTNPIEVDAKVTGINTAISGIPVYFSEATNIDTPPSNRIFTKTAYTNDEGEVTIQINGNGSCTNKYIYAKCSATTRSATTELVDYALYWSKIRNGKYGEIMVHCGSLLELENSYGIYSPVNQDTGKILLPKERSGVPWEVHIEGLVTPLDTRLGFVNGYSNTEGNIITPVHKYSYGDVLLKFDGFGLLTYKVLDGNTTIASSTAEVASYASPFVAFRNFKQNQQQATFREITYREGV